MALLIVVVLGTLGVAALVNTIARRPALNGGRIGAVSVLVLTVMRIGLNLSGPNADLGRRVGVAVGQALLPLLVCVWMDRRHSARVTQRSVGVFLLLALTVPPAASGGQQAAAPQPVPGSVFKGTTLIVPDLGFSIESPGPKWRWTKIENPTAKLIQFLADNPDADERFIVAVHQPDAPRPLDKADAEGFITGVAQTREQRGWKVEPKGCTPWPGVQAGWRCAIAAESAAQERNHYVAYVVSTKRFYAIQFTGSAEPPLFKTFAASFRLLK